MNINSQGGGYIAETYSTVIALTGKWVYQGLSTTCPDAAMSDVREDVQEAGWQQSWTVAEMKATLKSRGVSMKGYTKKDQFAGLISDIITTDGNLPPRRYFSDSGCPQEEVTKMIVAWCAVISRCMATKFDETMIEELEDYIKHFLSCWDNFEEKTIQHSDNKKERPPWTGTSNFPALLNLPKQISLLDPRVIFGRVGIEAKV